LPGEKNGTPPQWSRCVNNEGSNRGWNQVERCKGVGRRRPQFRAEIEEQEKFKKTLSNMYTKRIDIDGNTYLFNGMLVKGQEHSNGGHWASMGFSLRFPCLLSEYQVQFVLNNLPMFQASERMIVWKGEPISNINK
jgi:hypothetical protein